MNYIQVLLNLPKNKNRKLKRTEVKVITNKWSIIFNNACLTEEILPNYSRI